MFLFSSALFDLFSRQPRNRLMGIVFVDWNLVWVWGLKIKGGKSLFMGIADWNFSLLMGIVFLGNPEKEKSLGLRSENQRKTQKYEGFDKPNK